MALWYEISEDITLSTGKSLRANRPFTEGSLIAEELTEITESGLLSASFVAAAEPLNAKVVRVTITPPIIGP